MRLNGTNLPQKEKKDNKVRTRAPRTHTLGKKIGQETHLSNSPRLVVKPDALHRLFLLNDGGRREFAIRALLAITPTWEMANMILSHAQKRWARNNWEKD